MNAENIGSVGVTIGGGFLACILTGSAIKKPVKLVAIVVGLFFAVIAYLQYQQIHNTNWNKLEVLWQNSLLTLANATTKIPGLGSSPADHTTSLEFTNIGIPLTGSISTGFAIGFIRG